jgi:uncharacterized membrane protein
MKWSSYVVQVALLGSARELQKDLERYADSADTSTEEGLHYILTETVLSLMRNPEYWAHGSVASATERDPVSPPTDWSIEEYIPILWPPIGP